VAVLAPSRWMRAADVLPHSWQATSDSVAAYVAGALDAARLILVKPASVESATAVDPCFRSVLPAGLPCTVLPWDRVHELAQLLDAAP
jgi:5-(aminomethyl)-3-furanmethanol phosphate kinase